MITSARICHVSKVQCSNDSDHMQCWLALTLSLEKFYITMYCLEQFLDNFCSHGQSRLKLYAFKLLHSVHIF